jgi:3'-phosphoadenosine 5'-phosphosulfate (PAPS) 3'-phosphatase
MMGYEPSMPFVREIELALQLAEQCGQRALELRRAGDEALGIREKSPRDGPVTLADTEINARLVAALRSAFPKDQIIAEETPDQGDAGATRERCWFIDPIDGTAEYARGDTSWAIHIGLCVAGEPVLGVVHEPASARLSWGIVDGDATSAYGRLGDAAPERLHVEPAALDHLRLVSSKSHASPRLLAAMTRLTIPNERNLRLGSTGVKVAALAWGRADLYVHPRYGTKLWDTCAPQALLRAAGGRLSDLLGRPLTYRGEGLSNDAGLLASAASVHASLVDHLAELAARWVNEDVEELAAHRRADEHGH